MGVHKHQKFLKNVQISKIEIFLTVGFLFQSKLNRMKTPKMTASTLNQIPMPKITTPKLGRILMPKITTSKF
jgi:hypothetical protein